MTDKTTASAHDIACIDVHKRFHDLRGQDVWRVIFDKDGPYPGFDAVQGVSLFVEPGKFLGILGRNGAGKSSLLRTIGGVYQPTSGVVVLGHQASGIYELGVSNQLLMTGREYARRWLVLNEITQDAVCQMAEEIREFSELEEYFDKPIRTYSSGMRARLFFGVATAPTAKIFLIDEVLSVGDIYFTAKCWGRLKKKIANGASGILATHDWPAILKLCEKSCIMRGGKIIESGYSKNIIQRYLPLPEMHRDTARFELENEFKLCGKVNEDLIFTIPVIVSTELEVRFGFSVEQFVPDIGWEHILHYEPTKVEGSTSLRQISIRIPDLPLHAGEYALNLFLASSDPETGNLISCDQRGWVCGDEIRLLVKGESSADGYHIPVVWSIQ